MDDLILANHKFRKSHASRKRRRRKLARWHDFKVGLAGANWRAAFQADLVAVVVAERGLNTDFHIPLIRHFDGSLRFLGSARPVSQAPIGAPPFKRTSSPLSSLSVVSIQISTYH